MSPDHLDVMPPRFDQEDLNTIKMVIGDYGLQILIAIGRGARTREAIPIISGVPEACVHGRLPVLMDLELVRETPELLLTAKGKSFLARIH